MSKRTRSRNALEHRRKLRRIRRREVLVFPWNFDPTFKVEDLDSIARVNLYGFTRCPRRACRGAYRGNTVGRPLVVECYDCGFVEPFRPRIPTTFTGQGYRPHPEWECWLRTYQAGSGMPPWVVYGRAVMR